MQTDRDSSILKHMVGYCTEIAKTVERFGEDFMCFSTDSVYKNAVALCVLQVGELSAKLTDDFKNAYRGMPWTQIKALRNVVAHSYGKIDDETLWETVVSDIPALQEYCEQILDEMNA